MAHNGKLPMATVSDWYKAYGDTAVFFFW